MKHIVIITGSPRKGGNTDTLVKAFAEGAAAAGKTTDIINAAELKISPCMGCDYCKRNPEHNCIQKDNMAGVYTRLAAGEVLVFATPVYFYGASAQIKCLIDRLHNPIRNTFNVKKLALLAVCADGVREHVFDSVKVMYKSILCYFNLIDGGVITVNGVSEKGEIKARPELQAAYEMGKNI